MSITKPVKRRVGVIGTLVWDVIHGWSPGSRPVEGWGGIAYALSALDAALDAGWEIVPLTRVGADLAEPAARFMSTLRHVASDAALIEVPEPNNRTELRYVSDERREEFMSGSVPGWSWESLALALDAAKLDALYVNFLSGWELDLDVARRLRAHFTGPIYVDLHMLAWAVEPSGRRTLRRFDDPAGWCACFDFLQVNEDEMTMLAPGATELGEMAIAEGASGTLVTFGRGGVVAIAHPGVERLRDVPQARARRGAAGTGRMIVLRPEVVWAGPDVDPTGCGDVWGATFFARMLGGDDVSTAMRVANVAAGLNVQFHGVTGLASYLAERAEPWTEQQP